MTRPVFDYSGYAVLVTGGTSGIGAAIAAAYRDAGAAVTITGTRGSASDYDENLAGLRYLQLDQEDPASIDRTASALPALDILINNGGVPLGATGLDEYDPDVFGRAVNMLLTGAFRMAERTSGLLERSRIPGGASIVSTASLTSFLGWEMLPGYGSAKSGLLGMTRTLAIHWARRNIRVNAVAPGLTRSRTTAGIADSAEHMGPVLERTPIERMGEPEDVTGAVLFLTSAAASWITGQTLIMDGGFSIVGHRL
jgi:3-oxoacyl-[acyl-carrier protein] reductase